MNIDKTGVTFAGAGFFIAILNRANDPVAIKGQNFGVEASGIKDGNSSVYHLLFT